MSLQRNLLPVTRKEKSFLINPFLVHVILGFIHSE